MARESSIKIYRSTGTSAPASLSAGELAWIDDNGAGTLYIGDATAGAVKTIGGAPGGDWGTALRTDTALLGTTTMAALTGGVGAFDLTASNATAATQTTGNSSTKLATTAFVATAVSNAAPDMDAISDTNIGTGGAAPAAGHVLVYDGVNSTWDNQPISGDVTLAEDGTTSIISIPNGMVQMGTDTDGNFVSAVTAVSGETSVNISSGVGKAGDSVAVGLANNVTIPNNLIVTGDLTVSGTNTIVNTTTTSLADPVFKIGTSTAGKDRGVEFAYDDSGSAALGFFGMDDTDDKFKYFINGTNSSETYSGTAGGAVFGTIEGSTITGSSELVAPLGTITSVVATSLTGTLQTALQPNVTTMAGLTSAAALETVGTITTGVWNGTTIAAANGGTGQSSYTTGDLVYANSGTTLTKLTAAGNGSKMLKMNAGATAPEWSDEIDGGSF